MAGLADDLAAASIKCFGPKKFPAQLEGSKGFTKDICAKYGIPTAAYGRFRDKAAALAYLEAHGAPIVIKADGLAAGKGVTVAMDMPTAREAVEDIFSGKFGGAECVIEEFLDGEEASFFVLTDGKHALPLATATTSGWATATRAPTPAAWAPIRLRHACRRSFARKPSRPSSSPRLARCRTWGTLTWACSMRVSS